jgi:hypothetical protein
VLAASASACVLTPAPAVGARAAGAGDCETVYVTSNGFHTGIAIPGAAAEDAGIAAGGAPWVEFGWGEDGAYRGERLTPGLAVKAVLGGPGVLHVAPLKREPVGDWATPVAVSEAGLAVLTRQLGAEAVRDPAGRPVVAGPGKGERAVFLKARTPYRAWRTCNVWTAERLRAAGVPVRAAGSTLAPVLTGALAKRPGCDAAAVDKAAGEAGVAARTRGLVER